MIPRNNLATNRWVCCVLYNMMRYRLASTPVYSSTRQYFPMDEMMPDTTHAGTAVRDHEPARGNGTCRCGGHAGPGRAGFGPLGRRAAQRGVLPHLSLKSSRLARSCSSSFAFSWLRAAEAQRQVRGARGEGRGARGEGRWARREA